MNKFVQLIAVVTFPLAIGSLTQANSLEIGRTNYIPLDGSLKGYYLVDNSQSELARLVDQPNADGKLVACSEELYAAFQIEKELEYVSGEEFRRDAIRGLSQSVRERKELGCQRLEAMETAELEDCYNQVFWFREYSEEIRGLETNIADIQMDLREQRENGASSVEQHREIAELRTSLIAAKVQLSRYTTDYADQKCAAKVDFLEYANLQDTIGKKCLDNKSRIEGATGDFLDKTRITANLEKARLNIADCHQKSMGNAGSIESME